MGGGGIPLGGTGDTRRGEKPPLCVLNTGLGTGTWEMVDTLTSVCFHHGKVTIHLSSTGVNMDEGVNDFLRDFRDTGMGRG